MLSASLVRPKSSLVRKIILVTIVSILFSSCNSNQSDEQPFDTSEFLFESLTLNGFVIEPYGEDRSISFKTKGIIKNNTDNIYSSAIIESDIRLFLDNGRVLTNKDVETMGLFFDDIGGLITGQWQPQEEKKVNLETPRLSSAYAKYPIKKVLVDYVINGEDKINGQSFKRIFKTVDVTNEWINDSKKLLDGSTVFLNGK